ncbi:MAG TPA: hypothetical protein VMU99_00555 [Acidimicrobiales bacterium]|nr:hypothetical protein [Acidimicrobiales bacterium]
MPIRDSRGIELTGPRENLRSSTRLSLAISIVERFFGLIAALYFITWLLSVMSAHIFAGNSDGATVVLEGQSISSGNFWLHGWGLSNDSFWSIDAMFYALFVHIEGVTKAALHVVPALIAGFVILLGLWMVRDEDHSWRCVFAGGFLVLILALPNPDLSFFLLQGPWHIGTALLCLIAFAGLSSDRWGVGSVVAVLALAAAFLGDLATVAFGMAPVIFAGLSEMARMRSLRRGLPSVAAGLASIGLAEVGRLVLRHFGAFTLSNGITRATSNRYLTNVGHSMTWMTGLFGVKRLAIGPVSVLSGDAVNNGSAFSRIVHLPLLLVVTGGVAFALLTFVRGLIFGDRLGSRSSRSLRIDALLLSGIAGSVATYVYLCPNNNANYARYLIAAVIFGAILSARTVARALQPMRRAKSILPLALASILLVAAVAFATTGNLSSSAATQPTESLILFLEAHHLSIGVGDYWSSSVVTVSSGERVVIRPVITNRKRIVVRYGRQSDASWYGGTRFQFLVYNVKHPWRRINATTAITTFGRPKAAYGVGSFRIIVWPHPLSIGPVGFTLG